MNPLTQAHFCFKVKRPPESDGDPSGGLRALGLIPLGDRHLGAIVDTEGLTKMNDRGQDSVKLAFNLIHRTKVTLHIRQAGQSFGSRATSRGAFSRGALDGCRGYPFWGAIWMR
jgi:hypothetical protein